ncbi:helix-turn-helix domain-containing protein [Spartinivicinus marinus]|nr:helix-turn-helix transcriptional regulator [Spartinivicinus marinus]MCX4025094.1 helix-turn-helix transcriptional regulator [Spartinivicinus marinus]
MKLISTPLRVLILMSFSKRLTTVRKGKGLTQQQMAEVIGIHLSQVKRYESGETQPSLDVLRKIALALNVSADTLLFDEEERGPSEGFRMQFEAITQFSDDEKIVAKQVLDSLILQHTANRLAAKK